jgi:hypothetical protein
VLQDRLVTLLDNRQLRQCQSGLPPARGARNTHAGKKRRSRHLSTTYWDSTGQSIYRDRTAVSQAALLNLPAIWIKAAPAASHPALPAPGSALGGRPTSPPSHHQAALINCSSRRVRHPVFLALDCPDRGHRV